MLIAYALSGRRPRTEPPCSGVESNPCIEHMFGCTSRQLILGCVKLLAGSAVEESSSRTGYPSRGTAAACKMQMDTATSER